MNKAVDFGLGLSQLTEKMGVKTFFCMALVEETETGIRSGFFGNVEDNSLLRLHILQRRALGSLITMSCRYLGLSVGTAVGMLQSLLEEAGAEVEQEELARRRQPRAQVRDGIDS